MVDNAERKEGICRAASLFVLVIVCGKGDSLAADRRATAGVLLRCTGWGTGTIARVIYVPVVGGGSTVTRDRGEDEEPDGGSNS